MTESSGYNPAKRVFLGVFVGSELRSEPTNIYLQAHCANDSLLNARVIDHIRDGTFQIIDDPSQAVISLLERIGRDHDGLYLTSSTCNWDEVAAVDLTESMRRFLRPGGNIRFLQGKGCNVLADAVVLARQAVASGDRQEILVICVESCRASLNRLQGYAFFSDHCIGVTVSDRPAPFELHEARSFMSSYSGDEFSNTSELGACPSEVENDPSASVLMLNCFPFFLRFKFSKAPAFEKLRPCDFANHHFGTDPFLCLVGSPPPATTLIHVESPPGHIAQLVLTPNGDTR